jgi:hypothetical protein
VAGLIITISPAFCKKIILKILLFRRKSPLLSKYCGFAFLVVHVAGFGPSQQARQDGRVEIKPLLFPFSLTSACPIVEFSPPSRNGKVVACRLSKPPPRIYLEGQAAAPKISKKPSTFGLSVTSIRVYEKV